MCLSECGNRRFFPGQFLRVGPVRGCRDKRVYTPQTVPQPAIAAAAVRGTAGNL